jgi:Spy/CpxP family protein refolding chaperone
MKSFFALILKNKISNIKLFAIVAGVASVTLGAATIPAVLAQSNNSTNQPPRHENRLNLTSDQQAKMQQIHESERSQMDSILTADQKSRLDAAKQNGQNPRQVFESLNLTAEQKTQMEAVRRASREQMDALLTAEQRQQMQQHRPSRPEGTQPPQ